MLDLNRLALVQKNLTTLANLSTILYHLAECKIAISGEINTLKLIKSFKCKFVTTDAPNNLMCST